MWLLALQPFSEKYFVRVTEVHGKSVPLTKNLRDFYSETVPEGSGCDAHTPASTKSCGS